MLYFRSQINHKRRFIEGVVPFGAIYQALFDETSHIFFGILTLGSGNNQN